MVSDRFDRAAAGRYNGLANQVTRVPSAHRAGRGRGGWTERHRSGGCIKLQPGEYLKG